MQTTESSLYCISIHDITQATKRSVRSENRPLPLKTAPAEWRSVWLPVFSPAFSRIFFSVPLWLDVLETTMLHIALWEPEIPPNTGNIARLCAATGCPLHLIGRLGFRLDEKSLRRAGLDYWDAVELYRHDTLADFENILQSQGANIYCLSAHAEQCYTKIAFRPGVGLLFGAETRGLPPEVLERYRKHS